MVKETSKQSWFERMKTKAQLSRKFFLSFKLCVTCHREFSNFIDILFFYASQRGLEWVTSGGYWTIVNRENKQILVENGEI